MSRDELVARHSGRALGGGILFTVVCLPFSLSTGAALLANGIVVGGLTVLAVIVGILAVLFLDRWFHTWVGLRALEHVESPEPSQVPVDELVDEMRLRMAAADEVDESERELRRKAGIAA